MREDVTPLILRLLPPLRADCGGRSSSAGKTSSVPEGKMSRSRKAISMISRAMTSLNPVLTVGDQWRKCSRARRLRKAEAAARRWNGSGSPPSRPFPARTGVSPPDERRHAATGHDRHGAGPLAGPPDRRRASTALDVTSRPRSSPCSGNAEQEKMRYCSSPRLGWCTNSPTGRHHVPRSDRRDRATAELFDGPVHRTRRDSRVAPGSGRRAALPSIPDGPDLSAVPPGCPFAERCPFRREARDRFHAGQATGDDLAVCDREDPTSSSTPGHLAACHHQRASREGGTMSGPSGRRSALLSNVYKTFPCARRSSPQSSAVHAVDGVSLELPRRTLDSSGSRDAGRPRWPASRSGSSTGRRNHPFEGRNHPHAGEACARREADADRLPGPLLLLNPDESPGHRGEGARHAGPGRSSGTGRKAAATVGLPAEAGEKYPHEFPADSAADRIARAIALSRAGGGRRAGVRPDVSVQARS